MIHWQEGKEINTSDQESGPELSLSPLQSAPVYSGGTSWGQPFTHYGAVAIKDGDEAQRERAKRFGERIARKTLELFGSDR